jgi:hypothetical protein
LKTYTGKPCDLIYLEPDEHIPKDFDKSVAFIVQGGTLFSYKANDLYTILSPIDGEHKNKILSDYENIYKNNTYYLLSSNIHKYRIDKKTLQYVMKYFQDIYNEHKSECACVLFFNLETKHWVPLFVPQIDCSHASVNYLLPREDDNISDSPLKKYYEFILDHKNHSKLMKTCFREMQSLIQSGYTLGGTIHSHCDFNAFHSGVDDKDETNFNGLHITIGNVDTNFTFACRYIIDTAAFKFYIEDVVDIESEAELSNDLESIKISPYHLSLFITDYKDKKSNLAQVYMWPNSFSPDLWSNSNIDTDKMNFENMTCIDDDDDDDDDEWDDNVIDEEEGVRLFNIKTGNTIWVKYTYYLENLTSQFNRKFYTRIDVIETQEKTNNTRSNLHLIDDPRLNPNFSSKGNKIKTSEFIHDINNFRKVNRKAKRIKDAD